MCRRPFLKGTPDQTACPSADSFSPATFGMLSTGKENKSSELTPNRGEGHILMSPFRSTGEVSQCRSSVVPTARAPHQPRRTLAGFCRAAHTPSPGCRGPKPFARMGTGHPGPRSSSRHVDLPKRPTGLRWEDGGTRAAGWVSHLRSEQTGCSGTALAATRSSLPKALLLLTISPETNTLQRQAPRVWSVQRN